MYDVNTGARWALANPHLSLHIPTDSRLTLSKGRKKNGMPRRPQHNLKSVVSNLHLLTAVSSFSRWPLSLHFFAKEPYKVWQQWLKTTDQPGRDGLTVLTDFEPVTEMQVATPSPRGIHALPLDYSPMKAYIEKAHNVVSFEQEGKCVHCNKGLKSGKGLHPMCPNEDCKAMGHLDCWSRHALSHEEEGVVLPDLCTCPSCGGDFRWGNMMKELSLRIRGPKEVEKLLKKRKRTKKVGDEV